MTESDRPSGTYPRHRDLDDPAGLDAIALRARQGDQEALGELFESYRSRLARIARFRLDPRLSGRVDESDILQETYLRAAKRLTEFRDKSTMSPLVWLRLLLQQQLLDTHRHYFQVAKRDVRMDVPLDSPHHSPQTAFFLAHHLAANITSPSVKLDRQALIGRLEQSLQQLASTDQEIIALRHFEELSSSETAEVLGLERNTASKRYVRAVQRLQRIMQDAVGEESQA